MGEFKHLKKYQDYKTDGTDNYLSDEEFKKVKWTNYKIVVPTLEDKYELMEAFRHLHDSDIDTEYVTVNQLAHEYLDKTTNNIVVDEELFNKLNTKKLEK